MPSPHSSLETQADARNIAANLGVELIEIPIEAAMAEYESSLRGALGDSARGAVADEPLPRDPTRPSEPDLAAENIQARIRGNLMMALSNTHGWLVLTTGNKSEMSVGYATLYGDMAGGFAAIKDVPKTLVYELVRHRNEVAGRELIPASVLEREPSAELRPDQLDSDSLPPYELLDRDPRVLRRARRGPRGDDRRRAPRRTSSTRSCAWSTAPSTSAARRRRGSASRRGPSAATGACRSPTASAVSQTSGSV